MNMHNIEYYEYPENVNQKKVQMELDHHVAMEDYQEGCSGLNGDIRWLNRLGVAKDRDDAERLIKLNDRGWYDQLAVMFYHPIRTQANQRLKTLDERENNARQAYNAKNGVWAESLKAEFVGCRHCGSKLKRELIHTNICPVCRKDLRPDTTLAQVKAAELKWKKAQAEHNSYRIDHSKKEVRWLVKIEYHT